MIPEPDWNLVKKISLWSFEDLLEKLQDVLAYNFVQEHYNYSLQAAHEYNRRIRRGYLQDRGDMVMYIDCIAAHLEELEKLHVATTSELVDAVDTREQCIIFLQRTHFDFEALVQTLNYLLRWVLPFKTPLREFIDAVNPIEVQYLEALKNQKIRSNLDLLDAGRSAAGRERLADTLLIPGAFILALVHKADISRLAYVRGKTVNHLCRGGYDTLERIASAELPEMEAKMDAYYHTLGKSLADFKLVIPLSWMIGGAQTLPPLLRF